jgi:2-deoxy-scyllo-inosamine dehydrogenase (SAM-dependent)/8-amino-3,8-dideoxy-alpha-D-manno-octulosonate transaminase
MHEAIPLFERLEIETQSNCNRACWFCSRTYDRSGVYLDAEGEATIRRMPGEKVVELLDQAQALGFRGEVSFHFFSEPLLDKRNIGFARAARARGLHPFTHTNGDVLLRSEKLCRQVTEAYERVVVGLYDYRTDAELEEAKERWRAKLPGVRLSFSAIGPSGSRGAFSVGIPRALVPTNRRMSTPDLVYPNGPCSRPLVRLIVRHDGAVANCCEDLHADFDLGNVYERSLGELWFSECHVKVVRDLLAGRRERYELCRQCPLPPTGPSTSGERIRLVPRRYAGKVALRSR